MFSARYPLFPQPSQPCKVSVILRTGPCLGIWKLAVRSGSKGQEGVIVHVTGSDASNPSAWSPSLPLPLRGRGVSDWICSLAFGWLGCRGHSRVTLHTLGRTKARVVSIFTASSSVCPVEIMGHPLEKLLQRGQRAGLELVPSPPSGATGAAGQGRHHGPGCRCQCP